MLFNLGQRLEICKSCPGHRDVIFNKSIYRWSVENVINLRDLGAYAYVRWIGTTEHIPQSPHGQFDTQRVIAQKFLPLALCNDPSRFLRNNRIDQRNYILITVQVILYNNTNFVYTVNRYVPENLRIRPNSKYRFIDEKK